MSAWSKHVIKIRVSTKKVIIIYGHYLHGNVEQRIQDAWLVWKSWDNWIL